MTAKARLKGDELYVALMSFWGAEGAWVPAGSEWRGDSEVCKLHPQFFSRVADGQAGIDEASRAYQASIGEAQRNREKAWYGDPREPEPEPTGRAVAILRFEHAGEKYKPGDIIPADSLVVE